MTLHSTDETERRQPLASMHYKTDKEVAAAAVAAAQDDLPQDLSLNKRNGDCWVWNRTTDHSIANIMKRFADESREEEEGMDRKRQRVENIVHSICPRTTARMWEIPVPPANGSLGVGAPEGKRPRKGNRKQVQPQQHDVTVTAALDAGSCHSDEGAGGTADDNDHDVDGSFADDSTQSYVGSDDSGSGGGAGSCAEGSSSGGVSEGPPEPHGGSGAAPAASGAACSGGEDEEKRSLRHQLRLAKRQLRTAQRKCRALCEQRQRDVGASSGGGRLEALVRCLPTLQQQQQQHHNNHHHHQAAAVSGTDHFLRLLRAEISAAVNEAVLSSMEKLVAVASAAGSYPLSPDQPPPLQQQQQVMALGSRPPGHAAAGLLHRSPSPSSYADDDRCRPEAGGCMDLKYGSVAAANSATMAAYHRSFHPYLMQLSTDDITTDAVMDHPLSHIGKEKKKRTKVTDTRLSPRAAKALMTEVRPGDAVDRLQQQCQGPLLAAASPLSPLPTSVAIRNPTLGGLCNGGLVSLQAGLSAAGGSCGGEERSLSRSSECSVDHEGADGSDMGSQNGRTSTLTPLHLRKAKLMFFYVRYPSSVLLKAFFPDIRFNKNNTAQLVKWFSNFREFYYIQMEKYARQAIAEGIRAEEITVSVDSELYKILNLHYNRNNQIEVPRSYRAVVEATLKEFLKAISAGKDQEQSWKKPIYKIIARLDDMVPDFFKSQNWLEQLTD